MALLQTLSKSSFQLEYNLIPLTLLQSPPRCGISIPPIPQHITLLLVFETAPLFCLTSHPRSPHPDLSTHHGLYLGKHSPCPLLTLLTPTWLQLECHSHWEAFTVSSKLGEASLCALLPYISLIKAFITLC